MNSNRKISIRTIAKLAECSPSTVSRVLSPREGGPKISDETKKKILQICEQYNYRPNIHAVRFFSKFARSIGLLIPESASLCDRNLSRLLDGCYRELELRNYRLSLLSAHSEFICRKRYLDIFETREIDGLIIWGAMPQDSFLDELAERGLPFLLTGNRYRDYPCISCDDADGIRQMTAYCRNKGAKRLAYLSIETYDAGRRREEGFRAGSAGAEALLLRLGGNISLEDELLKKLVEFEPDAIICVNDPVALDVVRFLRLHGKSSVMVTGGDNAEFSGMVTPSLTTFDQRAFDCGQRAAAALVAHFERGEELKSEQLPVAPIPRESA